MATDATQPTPATRTELDSPFDSTFLKKLEYLYIISKKLFRERVKGERRAAARGTSVEFRDYRSYSRGDDFRYIDWNIFRRMEKLLIKLYEEEQEHNITLIVDTSRSMDFGSPSKVLYAKQVAAALAYIGLANHDRVSLATFTDRVTNVLPIVRGKGQIWNVFRFLELPSPEDDRRTAIADVCREIALKSRRSGIVILLSDFFDSRPDAIEDALKQFLHRKYDVYALHVVDRDEEEPPMRGEINLIDAETGELREVSVDAHTLTKYREAFASYCGEIESFCRSRGIVYLRANTSKIFDDLVLRVFREGGFLD